MKISWVSNSLERIPKERKKERKKQKKKIQPNTAPNRQRYARESARILQNSKEPI